MADEEEMVKKKIAERKRFSIHERTPTDYSNFFLSFELYIGFSTTFGGLG